MDEVRLIDANALVADYRICGGCKDFKKCDGHVVMCDSARVRQAINDAPTIEVQPVKHGYWEEKTSYAEDKALGFDFQIVCSECDLQNSYFIFGEGNEPEGKTFIRSKYCPNCGARMDGDKSD